MCLGICLIKAQYQLIWQGPLSLVCDFQCFILVHVPIFIFVMINYTAHCMKGGMNGRTMGASRFILARGFPPVQSSHGTWLPVQKDLYWSLKTRSASTPVCMCVHVSACGGLRYWRSWPWLCAEGSDVWQLRHVLKLCLRDLILQSCFHIHPSTLSIPSTASGLQADAGPGAAAAPRSSHQCFL